LIRECKTDEIWEQFERSALERVKSLLESGLEYSRDEWVECSRHERSHRRQGYRNGYYERGLVTSLGKLSSIRVPRVREGGFEQPFFEWYSRRREDFDEAVKYCFLLGCSTRKVGITLEHLAGEGVSAGTVSNILKHLDEEVKRFHQKGLKDDIVVLQVDGMWVHVRKVGENGYVKRVVLFAVGITRDGEKRILAMRLVNTENKKHWTRFLNDLYHRGLEGSNLLSVVHDGARGLEEAVAYVYPRAIDQSCVIHRARNASNRCVNRKNRTLFWKQASTVWDGEDEAEVRRNLKKFILHWREDEPEAVSHLLADFESTLGYLDLPKSLRTLGRSTNITERFIKDIRDRIRPMGCFSNNASVERIVFGLVQIHNDNNKGHTKSDIKNYFTHNP